jgi:hypothetical protein
MWTDDERAVGKFLNEPDRGCLYLACAKKRITKTETEHDLATNSFTPATATGIPLGFDKLVAHCEAIVGGSGKSLIGLSQHAAWRILAE